MATEKRTKRMNYAELRELAESAGKAYLVEFCDHEVELLDKKASTKAPTKTQKDNDKIKALILEILGESNKAMSIADMLADERIASYVTVDGNAVTNQKLSALLRLMGEKGTNEVARTEVKGKPYFKLAE